MEENLYFLHPNEFYGILGEENDVLKGENALDEHFFLFSQHFQMSSAARAGKVGMNR